MAMTSGQFILTRGARDIFISETELRQQARRGLLLPGDRVYHPVLGRWLYAREVAEVEGEMQLASRLGRRPPPEEVVLVPANSCAIAGFILSVLGCLPFAGLVCALVGLGLSARGLSRAQLSYGSGHRLAAAGVIVALCTMAPQLALLVWALTF
jgi:hypothetical protein